MIADILPENWTSFSDEDRNECYWCGDRAKYRFHRGDVLACIRHFPTAGPEFVAYTEVY